MITLANPDPQTWNTLIARLDHPHILQTWEWGSVKSHFGWQPFYCVWHETPSHDQKFAAIPKYQSDFNNPCVAAALVLKRRIALRGLAARASIFYVPKGPVFNWQNPHLRRRVLGDLHRMARIHGAIFIKIDPDICIGKGIPGSPQETINPVGNTIIEELQLQGYRYSKDQIQFPNTVVIDLTPTESELLSQMKQKTRYNIRLAERKAVAVRIGDVSDIKKLYQMYAETSIRDNFVIREEAYYRKVWETYFRGSARIKLSQEIVLNQPVGEPLIAEVDGEPVAALIQFRFAGRAYYLYGMSQGAHREKMPNHLLQWEAIRRAKATGCQTYDLWGAPDQFNDSDPMWGVYRFKEGLGGMVYRYIGAWDLPISRWLYRLYSQVIPSVLSIMRRRGFERTRQLGE